MRPCTTMMPKWPRAAPTRLSTFCQRPVFKPTMAGVSPFINARSASGSAGIVSAGLLRALASVESADAISRRRSSDKLSSARMWFLIAARDGAVVVCAVQAS